MLGKDIACVEGRERCTESLLNILQVSCVMSVLIFGSEIWRVMHWGYLQYHTTLGSPPPSSPKPSASSPRCSLPLLVALRLMALVVLFLFKPLMRK